MTTVRFYTPLAIVILIWQFLAMGSVAVGFMPEDMLPTPTQVAEGMWHLAQAGDLAYHVGVSVYRQMAGFLLAAVVGVFIGIGMAHFEWVKTTIEPLVRITYPLPKSALIPILILVFGIGHNSKIFAVFLGCLLPVVLYRRAPPNR